MHWSHYPDELVENSDFRKFDGTLRMIMDGSEAQYRDLHEYLEGQYHEGRLVAEVRLHQPDFGITPYRALLGALRVRADVLVSLSIPE